MKYRSKILLLPFCMLFQVACSNNAVYTEESFAYDSLFKLRVDGEVSMACESARRSLLGQGYLIEAVSSDGVKARKAYKSEDKENTFIEMNVVCLPETTGSTLFATGVLTTYALKMSSSSASVGLSALGSISLPIGQSADSLVKVSEETIDDKDFYRRFFAAVDTILGEMKAGQMPLEPVAEPTVSAPAAAPVSERATPEPIPAQMLPAAVSDPRPTPTQAMPEMVAEPTPVKEAPMTVPEHFPAHLIEPFE